jgi:hypothetical protein
MLAMHASRLRENRPAKKIAGQLCLETPRGKISRNPNKSGSFSSGNFANLWEILVQKIRRPQ